MINDLIEKLVSGLTAKLKSHHSLYRLPCVGEYLEELISSALAESGYINDWQPDRNHKSSVDFKLESGETFSVKSGEYFIKKHTLKFSGSRLGKHDNISEMVNSVISNSADWYICVSKVGKNWSPTPAFSDTKTYYVFVFPASALKYDSDWITVPSNKGFKYVMEIDGMRAVIHSSMSHQLWTWVSTNTVGDPYKLDII
jgi:hypothetical protein